MALLIMFIIIETILGVLIARDLGLFNLRRD